MKKKKKKYLIIGSIVIIGLIIGFILYKNYIEENNFIKLDYNEIIEKVSNKDTFILCVTASDCVHCKDYKPKLEWVANKYNIKVYYTETDKMNEENYKEFKEKFSFDGSTPTTIFFKKGKETTTSSRIDGDVSKEKIVNKLKKNGFIE